MTAAGGASATALRLSEERFRALVEQNSDAIVIINSDRDRDLCERINRTGDRNAAAGWVGHRLFERVDPALLRHGGRRDADAGHRTAR